MEFPNVLAFEAESAVKILREAGYECSIVVTEPPKFKAAGGLPLRICG